MEKCSACRIDPACSARACSREVEVSIILLLVVVIVALVFDFTNGFHDAANAIATVVATKALTMKEALVMAAILNLIGAFFATAVAETIETGLVRNVGDPLQAQLFVLAALIGAIAWNVLTWLWGIPSSSSHALVGGMIGAGIAFGHPKDIIWPTVIDKVIVPMLLSPVAGALIAFVLMAVVYVFFRPLEKGAKRDGIFRVLQVFAGGLMAFSHGANDAQKTMGIITLALVGAKVLPIGSEIPWWVVLLCAIAMALGTLFGGKRIITTAGEKITKLEQESGFAANLAGSITILVASRLGMPVSTTHVVVGSITGAGFAAHRAEKGAVDFSTWRNMLVAWTLTLPGSAGVGLLAYSGLSFIFKR